MVGYIIPVGTGREENWHIGRENGIWALKMDFQIAAGDHLFFWIAKKGLAAHAVVTSESTEVTPADILPWPDQIEQNYKWKFNFELVDEPGAAVERQWSNIQALLGTKDIPNKPAIRIDQNIVPLFVELFDPTESDPTHSGPPESSLAKPDLDVGEIAQDHREYAYRAIAQRRGQASFRNTLLDAFDHRCAVTGCQVEAVLEAAHIRPYMGPHTNVVNNGLLLRSDIHTLFDMYLLTVEPNGLVRIAPELMAGEYACLGGKYLAVMTDANGNPTAPSPNALHDHNIECRWFTTTSGTGQ